VTSGQTAATNVAITTNQDDDLTHDRRQPRMLPSPVRALRVLPGWYG